MLGQIDVLVGDAHHKPQKDYCQVVYDPKAQHACEIEVKHLVAHAVGNDGYGLVALALGPGMEPVALDRSG